MQQSMLTAMFFWHWLPSGWNTIQNQTSHYPNAMFVFFSAWLPCPSGLETIQNKNKCSKTILMQCLFFYAWLTLPKWMEHNPKPKQMQQSNLNAMFFLCMPYPAQVNGKQSNSKNKCSKAILAMFVFFLHDLPCPSEWNAIQNQNKCSKEVLMFFLHDFACPSGWNGVQPTWCTGDAATTSNIFSPLVIFQVISSGKKNAGITMCNCRFVAHNGLFANVFLIRLLFFLRNPMANKQ